MIPIDVLCFDILGVWTSCFQISSIFVLQQMLHSQFHQSRFLCMGLRCKSERKKKKVFWLENQLQSGCWGKENTCCIFGACTVSLMMSWITCEMVSAHSNTLQIEREKERKKGGNLFYLFVLRNRGKRKKKREKKRGLRKEIWKCRITKVIELVNVTFWPLTHEKRWFVSVEWREEEERESWVFGKSTFP